MTISADTREKILAAAWRLLIERGRADVPLAEIGAAAGVSRQTVFLAFGNRAGLLTAMARQADAASEASARMRKAFAAEGDGVESLRTFVAAWFEHIPEIFPVASLLSVAMANDADARAAWDDRMESLRAGYTAILRRAKVSGRLKEGLTVNHAADLAWSLSHIDAWRHLVVERGWSQQRFAVSRLELLERELLRP